MRWAMTARPRRWFVQIPDKRMRTREFGVKSICWTSPDLGEGGELWGFLGVGQGEKLGVNLAPISRHFWLGLGCVPTVVPEHSRKLEPHTQGRLVSGRKVCFYGKHPAVIQKYGIWVECHLFVKTHKSLGPLVAFLELSGTAGAQLCTQKLKCCSGNRKHWIRACRPVIKNACLKKLLFCE